MHQHAPDSEQGTPSNLGQLSAVSTTNTTYQFPERSMPSIALPWLYSASGGNGATGASTATSPSSAIPLDCYSLYILLTSRGTPGSYHWSLFLPTSITEVPAESAANSDVKESSLQSPPLSRPPIKTATGRLYQVLDFLGRWYVSMNASTIKLSTEAFTNFIVAVKVGTVDEHPALVEDFEKCVRSVHVPGECFGSSCCLAMQSRRTSFTAAGFELVPSSNGGGSSEMTMPSPVFSYIPSPPPPFSSRLNSSVWTPNNCPPCAIEEEDDEPADYFSSSPPSCSSFSSHSSCSFPNVPHYQFNRSIAPRTSREDFNATVWVKEVLKRLHDSGHITLRIDKGARVNVASNGISTSTPFATKVGFDPSYWLGPEGEGMMMEENAVNGAVEGLEKEVTALGVLCDPALQRRISMGHGSSAGIGGGGSGGSGSRGVGEVGKRKVVISSWTL